MAFFEIHTGNQWQRLILPVLARALGRSQDKIVLRSYLIGGGFGRRLDGDYARTGSAGCEGKSSLVIEASTLYVHGFEPIRVDLDLGSVLQADNAYLPRHPPRNGRTRAPTRSRR